MPVLIHRPVMVAAGRLNPAGYNPRYITPKMFRALKRNIRANGYAGVFVVQKKGMTIIGGHQGQKAIREICQEDGQDFERLKVPCIVLDVTDRVAMKLNIALNKIDGEFDLKKVGEVLSTMQREEAFKVEEYEEMGIGGSEEAAKYLALVEKPASVEEEVLPEFGKSVTCSLSFTDVGKRDHVKRIIEERAKQRGCKSGDVVYDMLLSR